jgi:hypothetical protein
MAAKCRDPVSSVCTLSESTFNPGNLAKQTVDCELLGFPTGAASGSETLHTGGFSIASSEYERFLFHKFHRAEDFVVTIAALLLASRGSRLQAGAKLRRNESTQTLSLG